MTRGSRTGDRAPAFQGCDLNCTAEGGYPALCEMYPKGRHVGCPRQQPPAHFNPPPMFGLREHDPWAFDTFDYGSNYP